MISLSISGSIEKGVEKSERKREVAEKVSKEFLEYIEKGKKAPNRDVRDGKQDWEQVIQVDYWPSIVY